MNKLRKFFFILSSILLISVFIILFISIFFKLSFVVKNNLVIITNILSIFIFISVYVYIIISDIVKKTFKLSKYLYCLLILVSLGLYIAKFNNYLWGLYSIYVYLISFMHLSIISIVKSRLNKVNVNFKKEWIFMCIMLSIYFVDFIVAKL